MLIYSDSSKFTETLLGGRQPGKRLSVSRLAEPMRSLARRFFSTDTIEYMDRAGFSPWNHLFAVENAEESQFDALSDLARSMPDLPDGILCVAGSGKNFHGFKGRPWVGASGNLHLSVSLRPQCEVEQFGVSFTALAVTSTLQALDEIDGLRPSPSVKWVNDIIIDDAKVGGVLATTHSQGPLVTHAIMGIGLNVETTPDVNPSPFVPRVGSIRQFSQDSGNNSLSFVFTSLLRHLAVNYQVLLSRGFSRLRDFYRSRSVVIGRRVRVHQDTAESRESPLISGTVLSIGHNLELILREHSSPLTSGRLELMPV